MNLAEIRASVLTKLREESAGAFTSTELNGWINDGIESIWNHHRWSFRKKYESTNGVYTLCSDAGTSTATTLYVDSVSAMQKGMYLYVSDDSNYEVVRISSINSSTNVVTLVSPGLTASYDDGDYVASSNIYLPFDCSKLVDIRVLDIETTSQSGKPLIPVNEKNFWIVVNYIKSRGRTTHYFYGEIDDTDEGKDTNFAADAGTDTTTVIEADLDGHEDDYYKGWKLRNTNSTHLGTARVKSYTYSGKILNLESVITGQTDADTFFLTRSLRQIFLYPIPDKAYRYVFEYKRRCPTLVNDYDELDFCEYQDELEKALVLFTVSEAMLADHQMDSGQAYFQKYQLKLNKTKLDEMMPADGLISMRPTSSSDLPGFYL